MLSQVERGEANPTFATLWNLTQALGLNLDDLVATEPVVDDAPVEVHLSDRQILRLPDEFAVDSANGVVAELRVVFGPDAILV